MVVVKGEDIIIEDILIEGERIEVCRKEFERSVSGREGRDGRDGRLASLVGM